MAHIKVRARALDMLGRQQMASVPNSLHELFKNAYDAYAGLARVDYYRNDRILTLADDGIGMTREEFETRWLTLGTESKVELGNHIGTPFEDPDKPRRRSLGEKGIGRLAIATVGPQVVIVSKADRGNGACPVVVSILNWSFFEVPGIDMDDLQIPLLELPPNSIPDMDCLSLMIGELQDNFSLLFNRVPDYYREKIASELKSLDKQLPLLVKLIQSWSSGVARGTIFLVSGADPIIERDLDEVEDSELPPPLLKNLRGFVNTMTDDNLIHHFKVRFFDHRHDGTAKELIGESEFFKPADFQVADQYIEGTFDEYGQFIGMVSIYHQPPQKYIVPWDGSRGKPTKCGPFHIKFAYLQGRKSQTMALEGAWYDLSAKLDKYGGLYIFKDGIRVLPYGNSDVDYLSIERRRSKAAKDWIFSYRRMFGAIELNSSMNTGLVEKAGREGFRENQAYRQFQTMLENFLKSLAMDWFRENTAKYGDYRERLGELQREADALEKRKKSVQGKREVLKKQLDQFFSAIDSGEPEEDTRKLKDQFQTQASNYSDTLFANDNALELLRLEADTDRKLSTIRNKYKINEPKNVSIGKSLLEEVVKSKEIYKQLEDELFKPLEAEYKQILTEIINKNKIAVSHGVRLRQTFQARAQGERQQAKLLVSDTERDTKALQNEINERTKSSISTLSNAFDEVFLELARQDFSSIESKAIEQIRHKLDAEVSAVSEPELDKLERLRNQVQSTLESIKEDFSLDEITARSEERAEDAEERLESYIELAHLGTAIGIIQHEFSSAVTGMRRSIQELSRAVSDTMHDDIETLRNSFEHLDAYLAMFTPLNRKLYRKQVDLSGKQIRTYISKLFESRLERHRIECSSTKKFEAHTIRAYPSTFLPPVINIIDNAIFWLSRDATGQKLDYTGPRQITFDADERGFLISNNGPVISERDADKIFEMSFTRKLRGRGMGLSLAKSALKREGYDILLNCYGNAGPPKFLITTERVEE